MSSRIQNLLEQANSREANDNSVTFAKRAFLFETDAEKYFEKVKKNLLSLGEWDKNSKASYGLYDENGFEIADKIITAGKFIRISVPGSGKDDWVKVIDIYDTTNEFVITVQPSYNPTETPVEKDVTSHFFNSAARNNFCLQRDDKEIVLYVIGLHEKANTKETDNPIESVRNAVTANAGYYLGAQKAMWKDFCANFLEIGK